MHDTRVPNAPPHQPQHQCKGHAPEDVRAEVSQTTLGICTDHPRSVQRRSKRECPGKRAPCNNKSHRRGGYFTRQKLATSHGLKKRAFFRNIDGYSSRLPIAMCEKLAINTKNALQMALLKQWSNKRENKAIDMLELDFEDHARNTRRTQRRPDLISKTHFRCLEHKVWKLRQSAAGGNGPPTACCHSYAGMTRDSDRRVSLQHGECFFQIILGHVTDVLHSSARPPKLAAAPLISLKRNNTGNDKDIELLEPVFKDQARNTRRTQRRPDLISKTHFGCLEHMVWQLRRRAAGGNLPPTACCHPSSGKGMTRVSGRWAPLQHVEYFFQIVLGHVTRPKF